MDRHLRVVAIMIEVTGSHMGCTHFNPDHSQMPAVMLQFAVDKKRDDDKTVYVSICP